MRHEVAGSHLAAVSLLEVFSVSMLSDFIWSQDKLMIGKSDGALGEVSVCEAKLLIGVRDVCYSMKLRSEEQMGCFVCVLYKVRSFG